MTTQRTKQSIAPALLLLSLSGAGIPLQSAHAQKTESASEAEQKPELRVKLGPWDNDQMRRSLWMRVSPMVRRGQAQDSDYLLEIHALRESDPGARVTIRDAQDRAYSIEVRVEKRATKKESTRLLAATIANLLEGVLAGRVDPGDVYLDPPDLSPEDLPGGEDPEPEPVEVPDDEVSVESSTNDELALTKPGRKAAPARDARARPDRFTLQTAPGLAFSLSTLPFDSGAVMFAPALGHRVLAVEAGISTNLTRTLETDLRFLYASYKEPLFGDTRLRTQVGLGIAPGWRGLSFPISGTFDFDYHSTVSAATVMRTGVRPKDLFPGEHFGAAVGVRAGIRRTWVHPGRRWRTSLGMDVAVRSCFEMWTNVPKAPNNIAGEEERPGRAVMLELDSWTIEAALVLRFGRWRERGT